MKRFGWAGAMLMIASQTISMGCTAAASKTPDLSGVWRLDPAHSSAPRFQGRPGREGRPDGETGRRWGGEGRGDMASGSGRERRGSRLRLPDLVRIQQSAGKLQLSDSLGVVLGEIRTAKGKDEAASGVVHLNGAWREGRLEVVQANPRGGQMTQTYHLAEDGRTLEIKTSMQGRGDMPAREFVRVYRREGA